MPPYSGPPRKNNNKNDIKSLRQLYRSSLPSLTELFPNWSQDDLLFVMDECQGELDLAIIRISEGHANQWGQVKSKKPKAKKSFKDPSTVGKGRPTQNKPRKVHQKQEKPRDIQPPQPSWASILRGPPKQEEIVESIEITQVSVVTTVQEDSIQKIDLSVDLNNNNNEEDLVQKEECLVVVEKEEELKSEEPLKTEETEEKEEKEEKEETVKKEDLIQTTELVIKEGEKESTQVTEIVKKVEPVHIIRKPTMRRLNQVEAVVLPNNQSAPISTVNVQFGSLNLSNGEEKPIEVIEPKVETPKIIEKPIVIEKPVVIEESPVIVQKEEQKPPIQQQQQQAGLVGHKVPIQPQEPNYNMNYQNIVPEYNMYNTMEQRMNYYDPSVYGQSPSMTSNHLFPREKYIAPIPPPPQEAGYYPYYYQPQQQYQPPPPPPIQSSVLGYPYVNKPMYQVYKPTTNEYPSFENDMIQQQQQGNNMMSFDNKQQQHYLQQKPMMDAMYYQQPQQQQYPSYYYPQQSRPYWHQA